MWTNRGALSSDFNFTAEVTDNNTYFYLHLLGDTTGATLTINDYSVPFSSEGYLPPELQGFVGNIVFTVTKNGRKRTRDVQTQVSDPCNGQSPPDEPQIYVARDPMQDWVSVSVSYGADVDTSEFYVDGVMVGANSDSYEFQLARGEHTLKTVVHSATNVDCKSQAEIPYTIPLLTDITNINDNVAVFEVDLVNPIAEGVHLDWPSPIQFVTGASGLFPRIYPVPSPFVHVPQSNGSYIYLDGAIKVQALRYPTSPVYNNKIMMLRPGEVDSCLAWQLSYVEGNNVQAGSYAFAGHTGGDLWLELAEGQGYPVPAGNISATYTDMQGLYRQPGAENYPPIVCWRDFTSRSWYSFQYKSALFPREIKLGAFAESGALLTTFLLQELTYRTVGQGTHTVLGGNKPTGATIPANTFFVSPVEVKLG